MPGGFASQRRSILQLGDRFRDARFVFRRLTRVPGETEEQERHSTIYSLAFALANASNGFLTSAESRLLSFLSSEPEGHDGRAAAYGFERYLELGNVLPSDEETRERIRFRFTRDQYFAAKRVLLMTGNDNALIHQENFLKVWDELMPALRVGLPGQAPDRDGLAVLCAAYTRAFVQAAPVQAPRRFAHPHLIDGADTNAFVAMAVSLVAGVTLQNDEDDPTNEVIYTSCIAACVARYANIAAAIDRDDDDAELIRLHATLLNHLP